jgi:hypothetical protein
MCVEHPRPSREARRYFTSKACWLALPAAVGAAALNQNEDPNPNSLPLLGDRDLEQLTFSFNSLLGVGDTPSWLQPPGLEGTQQLAEPLSDRPFAALFEK